jgi:Protein of unknown function (DUF3717)
LGDNRKSFFLKLIASIGLSASTAERKEPGFPSEKLGAPSLDVLRTAMPPLRTFTIQALEQAINRARQANPAQGKEASLSPEVAKLASLYGWMIYEGRQELSPDLLNAAEMETLARWL